MADSGSGKVKMKTRNKHILIACILIWLTPAICGALYQPINIVKTLIQSSMATVFSETYDIATPSGSDSPTEADDRMRETKAALQERLAVEHRFALTGTEVSAANTGEHTDITTDSIVNAGNITNNGNMTNIGTMDVTGDFSVNTDKFAVAGATGIVEMAGALKMPDSGSTFRTVLITAVDVLQLGTAAFHDARLSNATAGGDDDLHISDKGYADASPKAQMKFNNVSDAAASGANESEGSTTLANGTIMKWGDTARTGANTTITFSVAFPTACFQAIACGGADASPANDTVTHTIGASSFKARTTVDADPIRWFAIGR